MEPVDIYRPLNFELPVPKNGGDIGVKKFSSPPPSSKKPSGTCPDFLHAGPQ